MDIDSEAVIPARRLSGRLSKPSMDLLVDNQRLLAQYVDPKRNRKREVKKSVEEACSQSNYSEKSSLSSIEKLKPNRKKIIEVEEKIRMKSQRLTNEKTNEFSNGDNHLENKHQDLSITESNLLTRTPYVAIELNDIILKSVTSPVKPVKTFDNQIKTPDKISKPFDRFVKSLEKSPTKCVEQSPRSVERIGKLSSKNFEIEVLENRSDDDDLPLSKVYPDFKPRVSGESCEKRDTFALPPKKKIKFIKEFSEAIQSSPSQKVPKLKLSFSSAKASVMSMPKIPKKCSTSAQLNGSSDTDNPNPTSPTFRSSEEASFSEPDNEIQKSNSSPILPVGHQISFETTKRCIRLSCTNIAIEDLQWDKEFCSPDCAIMYSKFMFNEWLNQRKDVTVSDL